VWKPDRPEIWGSHGGEDGDCGRASGLWRHIVLYVVTIVSEDFIASIFRFDVMLIQPCVETKLKNHLQWKRRGIVMWRKEEEVEKRAEEKVKGKKEL
jgi:hypothetical protein